MKLGIMSHYMHVEGERTVSNNFHVWKPPVCYFIVCLFILLFTAGSALAEEKSGEQKKEPDFLEWPIGDNWVLSPVILPIYSPETEFAIVLGGMATFSTQPEDEELPRSTISMFAIPNSRGGLGFNADLESFWLGDRLRFGIEGDFDKGPDDYWGVGYDAGKNIEEDEEVTEFDRDVVELPLVAGWRIAPSVYVGINYHLLKMKVNQRSTTQEHDPNYLKYGDDITNIGAGIRLLYDTRDDTLNAYLGRYVSIEANSYGDWLGSDQEFEKYKIDYRQYHQIGRPGRTIAWQVAGQIATGDVPWVSMPTVGSSGDLRGYTKGRFRDEAVAWALVEYRHMTDAKLWNIGRQGFALWGGIGAIGEDFGDFGGHELPNLGIGYRVEVQDRRNLRLDLGWGYDEVGIYLNFAEAF